MKTEINYKAVIPYFICTVTYIFAAITSSELISQTLIFYETSYNDLEHIYYYDILGYAIAGVILMIISSYFSFKQIAIFSLCVHLTSLISLGFSRYDERLTEIDALIYSGTNLIVIAILLSYSFSDKKITKSLAMSSFFAGITIAYFLADLLLQLLVPNDEDTSPLALKTLAGFAICCILMFLFIFINNVNFKSSVKSKTSNILIILKNIELEMLSFFSMFYIIMTIFYDYEVYELTDSLLIMSVSMTKYYLFIVIFFIAIILQRIIIKYGSYKVNFICILGLLFTFLAMPFWGHNSFASYIFWPLIGILLYIFCYSNFIILAEKFEGSALRSAIILCSVSAAIGYYCGYITIDNTTEDLSETRFLISICLVKTSLLAYYFYAYKKYNLSKW